MKTALIVANTCGFISCFLNNDIELLKKKGYHIDCACNSTFQHINDANFFKNHDVQLIHIDLPIRSLDYKLITKSYREIKLILSERNYDLVHSHTPIASAIVRQAAKKLRKNSIIILYTIHGFFFHKHVHGLLNRAKSFLFFMIEAYFSLFTDAMITINEEDFINAKKMFCKNVFKIPGVGTNVDKFTEIAVDRDKYREKLNFSPTDVVVLAIGELNQNKNHKVLIQALSIIKNKNIILAICGREIEGQGLKKQLEKLAENLGVRLIFLGFRKDIPEICACADIGAIVSFKEGLGQAGLEMLAAGLPLVGSNRQGIIDYVIDGVTGYLCDPESRQSVATAIENLLSEKHRLELRFNCIKKSKEFDTTISRIELKKIYDTVFDQRNTTNKFV
jgi:glycosyltransferase involved in cell wall biosynthesis